MIKNGWKRCERTRVYPSRAEPSAVENFTATVRGSRLLQGKCDKSSLGERGGMFTRVKEEAKRGIVGRNRVVS